MRCLLLLAVLLLTYLTANQAYATPVDSLSTFINKQLECLRRLTDSSCSCNNGQMTCRQIVNPTIPTDTMRTKLHRSKREPGEERSGTKIILEGVRDGATMFGATTGIATLAAPNPFTAVAAGVSGAIAAVTGVIAANIK